MKLTIKELAPYLPYGLTVTGSYESMSDVGIWEMVAYDGAVGVPISAVDGEYLRPVLRPLSDLTKDIEGYGYKKLLEPELAELGAQENIMPNFRKSDYEILLMHHFDVFGLIDQGLAVKIQKQ